jgi:lipoprotein LprG
VSFRAFRAAFLTLLLGLALALAGCSSAPGPAAPPPPPPGPELLARSADAMAKLKSVAIDMQADPALTGLTIRSANGTLTATGEGTGSAVLQMGGAPSEIQFVVTKGVIYIKGPTGGYQALPLSMAAGIYDPTALLRPDSGIAALLRTARSGVTERAEDVNGVPAWRVFALLDPKVAGTIVPGVTGETKGTVWIDQATSRALRAQVQLPTSTADPSKTAPVTVNLSGFDAPVTVKPPTS